jgi:hypothetical protein
MTQLSITAISKIVIPKLVKDVSLLRNTEGARFVGRDTLRQNQFLGEANQKPCLNQLK